ncbi:MAG: hypothetical protein ACKV1O_05680 [Saprospiraceae bacterium]
MRTNISFSSIVFGLVVLVGMVFIFGQEFVHDKFKSGSGGTEPDTPVVDTTKRQLPPPGPIVELNEKIDDLRDGEWNKHAYESLKDLIHQKRSAGMIKKDEETNYIDELNIEYIETVNRAAKLFFETSTYPDQLNPVYQELKRYYNDPLYKNNVKDYHDAAGLFYQLTRKEQAVKAYLAEGNFDEDSVKAFLQDISELSSKIIRELNSKMNLAGSPLVNRISGECKERLIQHTIRTKIEPLKHDIQTYWGTKGFEESITESYEADLEELRKNAILQGRVEVNKFCKKEKENLDKHRDVHQILSSSDGVKYSNKSCEEICEGFKYYKPICDSLQNLK